MTEDPLEALRRLCLALPDVTERLSHGEPTWFVQGKKTFVTTSDHHHDDRVAFWCAAPPGAHEILVAAGHPSRPSARIAACPKNRLKSSAASALPSPTSPSA